MGRSCEVWCSSPSPLLVSTSKTGSSSIENHIKALEGNGTREAHLTVAAISHCHGAHDNPRRYGHAVVIESDVMMSPFRKFLLWPARSMCLGRYSGRWQLWRPASRLYSLCLKTDDLAFQLDQVASTSVCCYHVEGVGSKMLG